MNIRRQGRTDPIAIWACYSSSYGMMMVGYGAMMTWPTWSQWILSYFSIRCDVVSVFLSNHFFSQQLNNHPTNRLLLSPNMPMLNSHTFQSASGVNTITRPVPKRSGGDYPSGQQVVITNLVSFWWKTDLFQSRSMIWSLPTFLWPKSSRLLEWTTTSGFKPFSTMKSWRGSGGKNWLIHTNDSYGESSEWGWSIQRQERRPWMLLQGPWDTPRP